MIFARDGLQGTPRPQHNHNLMDEVFGKVTHGTAPDSAHQSLYTSALRPHTVRSLLPDCGPIIPYLKDNTLHHYRDQVVNAV
jgi:hypothetical protein